MARTAIGADCTLKMSGEVKRYVVNRLLINCDAIVNARVRVLARIGFPIGYQHGDMLQVVRHLHSTHSVYHCGTTANKDGRL